MSKEISIAEVKKHKDRKSLWIVIHNDVYDVTKFLAEHPGGEDTLLGVAGRDGTQEFEDVGHSDDARQLLKKYKIGSLPAGERDNGHDILNCCPPVSRLRTPSKSWRTFDRGSSHPSGTSLRPSKQFETEPRPEKRVQSIFVPRERHTRCPSPPPPQSSRLKWLLLVLTGAIVIGVVVKKYSSH